MNIKNIFKIVCILGVVLIILDQTSKIIVNSYIKEDISESCIQKGLVMQQLDKAIKDLENSLYEENDKHGEEINNLNMEITRITKIIEEKDNIINGEKKACRQIGHETVG